MNKLNSQMRKKKNKRIRLKDNRMREDILNKRYNSNILITPDFEYELNKYGDILIDYGL